MKRLAVGSERVKHYLVLHQDTTDYNLQNSKKNLQISAVTEPGSLRFRSNIPPQPPPNPPPPPTQPVPKSYFDLSSVMASDDQTKRYKLLPILVFQFLLVIIYFLMVRYDHDYEVNLRGFMDVHVMIFVGFGFLMTFLKRYSYSALGINLLISALAIQWAIVCQNLLPMVDSENWVIRVNQEVLVEADIMAATVLITFGAILGYTSPTQLLYITIVEVLIASFNGYLMSDVFQAADIGGSIGVHTFGAYFGLGVSAGIRIMSYAKTQPTEVVEQKNGPTYTSDITAMIGTLFLWIYWPSFNATLAVSDSEYQRAIVNTYLALASCTVITFVLSALMNDTPGRFDMVHVQNSTLAGGVAAGAVSNMLIGPGGALLIGIGAAIISVPGYIYLTPKLNSLGYRDTCGVHNLHGMPGVFSGLLSILFAATATPAMYGTDLNGVFPAMALTSSPRSAGLQALFQLIALAVTIIIALVSGLISGLLCNVCAMPYKHRYEDNPIWEMPHDYPGRDEHNGARRREGPPPPAVIINAPSTSIV